MSKHEFPLPDLVPLTAAFEKFCLIYFISCGTLFLYLDISELCSVTSIFIFLISSSDNDSISFSFRSKILLFNTPNKLVSSFPYIAGITFLISKLLSKFEPQKFILVLESCSVFTRFSVKPSLST